MRPVVLALLLALLGPATLARAESVRAEVVPDDEELVRLRVGEASWSIAEPRLRASLAPLAGRTITLDVPARPAEGEPLAGARVTDPPRVEARGHLDQGALVLDEGRGRLSLAGPAAGLVPAGRAVVVDGWRVDGELVALAVEGTTTGQWTLLNLMRGDWPTPIGVIRGRRAVWVLEAQGGQVRIRRGRDAGWVDAGQVEVGEPLPADGRRGLDDHLPR